MKKIIALLLMAVTLFCCLAGCKEKIKEYDKTPLASLVYTQVDYNGGYTTKYIFDFDKNIVTRDSYLPTDSKYDLKEELAEFSDEEENVFINRLYSYGLFDIKEEYKSPPNIIDGGGWRLEINYNDGTSKVSRGSNNSPSSVFSKCAKAFFDICGYGVVGRIPSE